MALVNVITITLRDVAGDKSTVTLNFPVSVTEAQGQSFLDTIAPLLDAITDSVFESASWVKNLILPSGLKTTPGAQRNQVGGLLTFDVADTNYVHSIRIPAMKASKLAGKSVAINDADVVAFINALRNGAGGVAPTNRFGGDLQNITSGMVSYRRRG